MTIEVNQGTIHGDGPGLRLKKARETLNLTLDDVAKHLKSNKKIIEALEKEDFLNLPQPIYVCGYLRSYANLVSLPAGDIVESYPNLSIPDPVLPKFNSTNASAKFESKREFTQKGFHFRWVIIFFVLVVIPAAGGWLYTQSNIVSAYVSELLPKQMVTTDSSNSNSTFVSTSTPISIPNVKNKATDLHSQLQEEILQELNQEQPNIAASVEEVTAVSSRLLFELTKNSWIEVVDAKGEKLLYRTIKAPARRIVEGEAPFRVFLGNAPGVSVNYNGLPFDLRSFIDGDVAQLTIGKAEDNARKVN